MTVFAKTKDCILQRIVHYRVKFVSAKPRLCVVPDFSYKVKVFFKRKHCLPHFLNKKMRYFICNVHTDSVYVIIPDPFFAYADKVFADFWIIRVQLGHKVCKGKRKVFFIPGIVHFPVIFMKFKVKVVYHKP